MTNQDVVFQDMAGIAAALPGALFACRGAAGAVSSLRRGGAYGLGGPRRRRVPRRAGRRWPDLHQLGRRGYPRVLPDALPRRRRARRVDGELLRHPSALGSFDDVAAAAKGKKVVMFMDYDGTLSPIVTDPDRAFMSAEMRAAVRDVAKLFPTALVTGRCLEKVYSFVGLSELYYAGSHGMDIKGPSSSKPFLPPNFQEGNSKTVLLQPAREFLPVIDKAYRGLVDKTKATPGARVENNKFCLSVHFRCVDEKRWSPLAEQVKAVLRDFPELKLSEGRKVLEIRPSIMWDKGRAVEFLLKSLGFDDRSDVLPVYIGDDRTDEDAFKMLRKRGQGIGILVSKFPKETDASYSLKDPTEVQYIYLAWHNESLTKLLIPSVMEFLHQLVHWKRRRSPSAMRRPRVQ
ncbi:hypothetical protein PR202_ga17693 [Eleusine coracana subsp. coracana]|uniref:Trehalose 6-phosphate phosphatase n=1 Tax=Eleusine coracana subsp. coracana TaxID=191504 RepID=A0AAV5CQ30_ELECO|nr:hypothetical protein PR202_ga17446 [Eleusine coracana subsp. coracana]GJN00505.1 hypothetical protein PR202_ga17693 [Eleusine coracana subsp. coracana]